MPVSHPITTSLRIAFHVPRASYLKPGFSGDKVLVPALIAGLQERGHQVKIVSRINARDFWRGRVSLFRLFAEAISIRQEMKRFSPDVWLVFNASVKNPDLFGWWQHPKRYVLINTDVAGGKAMPRWWRKLFMFIHRRSLARADKVIAAHPQSFNDLRSLGIMEERLGSLPITVKIWDRMPSKEDSRRRLGLPEEAPIILCVSRLSLSKTDMILDLMTAVSLLPSDVVLLLVGDGPCRQRVENEAVKLKPKGRVRIFSSVQDIKPFYSACDFFAYPYQVNRPWVVCLEAQACGRPVVTMQTDSAKVIVDHGRTGLLARDLEEFQAQIEELARDRARCESMGKAAREYIERNHSIEVRLKQIEDLPIGSN